MGNKRKWGETIARVTVKLQLNTWRKLTLIQRIYKERFDLILCYDEILDRLFSSNALGNIDPSVFKVYFEELEKDPSLKKVEKIESRRAKMKKEASVTAKDVAAVAQAADGVDHSEASVTPEKECNNVSSSEELPKDNATSDKFYFINQAGNTVEAHVGYSAFYAILNNKYVGCWNMYRSHWKLLCPDGRIVEEVSEAKAIYLKEKTFKTSKVNSWRDDLFKF